MLVTLVREQQPGRTQIGDDPLLGLKDLEPRVRSGGRGEPARAVDGRQDRKPVPDPCLEVVGAVAGRGVDEPGPGLHLDVVGADQRRIAVEERMARRRADDGRAGRDRATDGDPGRPRMLGDERVGQRRGDDDQLVAELEQGVLLGRVERDRDVAREGPRRRRPDGDRDPRSGRLRQPEPA